MHRFPVSTIVLLFRGLTGNGSPCRPRRQPKVVWWLLALIVTSSCTAPRPDPADDLQPDDALPPPPSALFGDFYERVAMSGLFEDSKQWADAVPERPPAEILDQARRFEPGSQAALGRFLEENFDLDPGAAEIRQPPGGLPLREHIDALWPLLTRQTPETRQYSSRLPLPHPYVVPGGRFREVYYWDSYFTMLGFGPEQDALKRGMVANFAHQLRSYGHIPNGNRTYYLSRSQPPFFFMMVALLSGDAPGSAFAEFLPELKAEHAFWMQEATDAGPGAPVRRVVRMPDGSTLNRYWDARHTPRDESYREDVAVAASTARPEPQVYRHIRAAAESGWDFSSRWMADGRSLRTIRTTEIVPIDLNSLLYGLEQAIETGCREIDDRECTRSFRAKAAERRAAVRRYLWNEQTGLFDDWHWPEQRRLGHITAASLYPLFFGLATDAQARRVATVVSAELVRDGGVVTTDRNTGEQWDAPNGWAPLQWIAVQGLRRYEHQALAETIACRWVSMVSAVFSHTGRLLEKYDVVTLTPGGGGEYPLQDGFGWTNGVTVGLLRLYPHLEAEERHVEEGTASCPQISSARVSPPFAYASTNVVREATTAVGVTTHGR